MKLGITGKGHLTIQDLEICIPDDVDEIIADAEMIQNKDLVKYCESKNIKLNCSYKQNVDALQSVFYAVILTDAYISYYERTSKLTKKIKYVSLKKEEWIIIEKDGTHKRIPCQK